MNEVHRLGVVALREAYARGDTTPSAVVAHAFARIGVLAGLNAFADLDQERAATAAAESDRRVKDGKARPLEGVTVGVKSNIAVAALPWTAGMQLRRGIVAAEDAAVVRTLREAGAIVLGTCGMHEAALGATSDNHWFGRVGNPHRQGVTPGGSSGGSGAAVAAGLCAVALGTDTLGSVRIPAAYNGVYGLKPTHRAVPEDGLVPLDASLDAIGPLTRSVPDLAAVWAVLAPSREATTIERVLLLDRLGDVEVDPGVRAGYDRALAALGAPRGALTLPDSLPAIRLAGFIAAGRALIGDLGPDRHARLAELSPELTYMLDFCASAEPRPDVLDRTRAALRQALGDARVLLLPTAPQVAFAHGRAPVTQADFTGLANVAGLPALSLPSGRDERGMPVAVQLIGPPGSGASLLELADTLDRALGGYAPPPGF